MVVDPLALWDFRDPAGSAQRFREAVGLTDGTQRLLLLTQLARAEGLQGRYDHAHRILEQAADHARAAGLEALRIDALHMAALTAPAERRLDLTRAALTDALASTEPAARSWEPSPLNNIGMCLVDAGELEEALDSFRDALEACERLDKPVGDVRVARWMIGWALRLLGRTREALEVQEALKSELDADGGEDPYVDEELALMRA